MFTPILFFLLVLPIAFFYMQREYKKKARLKASWKEELITTIKGVHYKRSVIGLDIGLTDIFLYPSGLLLSGSSFMSPNIFIHSADEIIQNSNLPKIKFELKRRQNRGDKIILIGASGSLFGTLNSKLTFSGLSKEKQTLLNQYFDDFLLTDY